MGQVVQLFSNPGSGRHSRRKIADLAAALEARGASVLMCESAGGAPHIAEEATHVCVAGGDGTVRHVADAVIRQRRAVALSIYPAGTVNLLALEAGYPREPGEFAAFILDSANRREHFPVALDDGHFFACAGAGPDSLAVAQVSNKLKRTIGRFAYGLAGLKLLFAWQRHSITLDTGERQVRCEAFYVAKGRYYAGRWSFAKHARVGEPVLHVVALRQARRRDYLRFVSALATGRDVSELPNVEAFTCTSLHATGTTPVPLQADGDIVGSLPVRLAVRQAPLIFC